MSYQDDKPTPGKTLLQHLFNDKELLTSRPEGMSYEEYKALLAMQNHIIKAQVKAKPSRSIANMSKLNKGVK
jgi:hypothetical protein